MMQKTNSSLFNDLYRKICEDEIFKASTPEEGALRRNEYFMIQFKELVENGKATKNPDGSYDVDVYNDALGFSFSETSFSKIPIRLNKIIGDFDCSINPMLTSLDGFPRTVIGTVFCNDNPKLVSLVGCPKNIGRMLDCSNNPALTSLKGCPEIVPGNFRCCSNSSLDSLDGCPKQVLSDFFCYECKRIFTKEEVRAVCDVKGYIHN